MAWKPAYATAVELAEYLRIGDDVDNVELGFAVESASRAIDHATNRQFGVVASAEERTYPGRWSRRRGLYVVDIDDVMTAAGLVVTVSGAAVTAYELTPLNAAAEGRPWTRIGLASLTPTTLGSGPATVTVEAVWGWTSVPTAIRNACLLQASRIVWRRQAPAGVAGSPDLGSEIRLLAKLDPDVAVMVESYRRDYPMLVNV